MRVLVVEDDGLVAMAICDALNDAGYEVIGPASTASKGLELAQFTRPDLALLDVDLGGKVKGTHLASLLAGLLGTKVIFVSGNVEEMRAVQDSALGYISKPCTATTLVESVEFAKAIADGAVAGSRIPKGLTLFAAR